MSAQATGLSAHDSEMTQKLKWEPLEEGENPVIKLCQMLRETYLEEQLQKLHKEIREKRDASA